MSQVVAIVPAAGHGTRMGSEMPKQFLELDGVPMVIFTLQRLAACPSLTQFVVATRGEELAMLAQRAGKEQFRQALRIVRGGASRHESVERGLAEVPEDTEIVLVHDAVRPFVTAEQAERVIAEARSRGAAILGIPAIDTVKEVKRGSLPEDMALISATISRERIVLAQTPQAFQYPLLRQAFERARQDGVTASDEATLVERLGHPVHVVLGSERNLKITRPADMELARFYLQQERSGR